MIDSALRVADVILLKIVPHHIWMIMRGGYRKQGTTIEYFKIW
jgi:hypothetical protein